jgi:hypothetical protein
LFASFSLYGANDVTTVLVERRKKIKTWLWRFALAYFSQTTARLSDKLLRPNYLSAYSLCGAMHVKRAVWSNARGQVLDMI